MGGSRTYTGLSIWLIIMISLVDYGHAQSLQDLPVLEPSYSHDLLKDKEGIKVDCVRDVFSDQQGRLWLKTCGHTSAQRIEFLQYDGYHHKRIQAANLENSESYSFSSSGISSDHKLYGHYNNRTNRNHGFFFMDLETNHIHTYPAFWNSTVNRKALISLPDSSLMIFATIGDAIHIKTLKSGIVHPFLIIRDSLYSSFNKGGLKAYYQKGEVWLMREWLPIFRIHLQSKSIRTYTLADFPKEMRATLLASHNPEQKDRHFSVSPSGRVDLILGTHFFQLDQKQDRFLSIDGEFPFLGSPIGVYQDKKGNVCLVGKNENGRLNAILEDTQGERYDFSAFFRQVSTTNVLELIGTDFFREVYVAERGSLHHMYVQELQSINRRMDGYYISSIMELPNRSFLINTVRDGWFQLSADGSQFQDFHGSVNCVPNPFMNFMSEQIIPDGRGRYWWLADGRLYQYHPQQERCKEYHVALPGRRKPTLFAILEEGTFVFSNWDDQLQFYNLAKREFFDPGGTVPRSLPGTISDLMVGKEGFLWVPTSNGLWKIDWKKQEGMRIDPESGFEEERFRCVYQDESGKMWVGTSFNGIAIYDPDQDRIEKTITIDQGLANNSVNSIFSDKQGDIWVSTENGMSLLSPQGEVITSLYAEDGLNDNYFARFDPFVARDGRLFVGNQKGLNIIDPIAIKTLLKEEQTNPKIFLTDLVYYDADLQQENHIQRYPLSIPDIHLPADQRNLTISFGISTYVEPNRHNYAYRLRGIEEDWNYLGPQHSLKLASLPAGQYTLQVKGSDFRNNWSENILEVPIHAEEFFYKTIWFYLLLALPFLLFGLLWIYRVQRENVKLEATVAARTQQIREDKALIEAQAAQLQELDQAKSRFFTNISHEFRTPLTVIGGMADQIQTHPEKSLKKGIQLIQRNVSSLLGLINQILDLRKLESGNLQLNLIQDEVVKFLRYGTESFESLAASRSVSLHFQTEIETQMMDFDPEKLLQIQTNLISNALKFTPSGGSVKVRVDKTPDQHVHIQVKDTGKGIPPEKLPLIFDRFYQVDQSDTREGEGTGIGLSLTKELVTLMKGEIRVDSQPGQGSTFTVLLPITRQAPVQTAAAPYPLAVDTGLLPERPASPPAVISPRGESPSLLIIEDNPDIVSYLYACLEDQYELSSASDGQAGIEAALEQVPDLIITDVMMPRKNGYELTETLKLDPRTSHIPIVMLTARADQDSRLEGYQRGADAYLPKPFDRRELMIRLEKLLELRRMLQARYQQVQPPTPSEDPVIQVEDAFISRAKELILTHLDDGTYRGEALSKDLAMSRVNLHRKLKALTGLSTSHFIRSVKIEQAKGLLQEAELQVAEVAYAVGFNEPAYFSRIFSEITGLAPGEWRSNNGT